MSLSQRLPENQTSVKRIPCRINLLNSSHYKERENLLCDDFTRYIDKLHKERFVLVNHTGNGEVYVSRRLWVSRYSKTGQRRIKKKVEGRMGHYYYKVGIMVSLSLPHGKFSRYESWAIINSEGRRFIDELNKWRKRHNFKTRLSYVKFVESQPDSHYAHLHFYFSGLKFLAPHEVIDRAWGYGDRAVNTLPLGGHSGAKYAMKYISKLHEDSLMMAYLYHHHLRLYSFSRTYKPVHSEVGGSGWYYLKPERGKTLDEQVHKLYLEGYYISNIALVCKDWVQRSPPLKENLIDSMRVSE